MSAAVIATTATSCGPGGVERITVVDGMPTAVAEGRVYQSSDGVMWRSTDLEPYGTELIDAPERPDRACFESGVCVDVVAEGRGNARLELADGDDVTVIATLTRGELEAVSDSVNARCGDVFPYDAFVVEARPEAFALVPMSEAGALHVTEAGAVSWVAIGPFGLTDGDADLTDIDIATTRSVSLIDRVPPQVAVIALLIAGPLVALAIIPIRRLAKRNRRDPLAAVVVCVVFAILLTGSGWGTAFLASAYGGGAVLGFALAYVAIATIVVAPLLLWHQRPRRATTMTPPSADERVG